KITGEQHELVTEFVWDGSHLVQEIDHKTDRTYNYIYSHLNSYEPLAQVYNEGDKQVVNYFHCDQIGVPREMTGSQGNIIWKGSYYAWGQLKPTREHYSVHQPFRLQNQYFDRETGLHYNFLRYYNPILGRFINQDPIGLQGGENLYRLEGTAQNQTDPLGLFVPAIPIYAIWGLLFGTATYIAVDGTIKAIDESQKSSSSTSSAPTITKECDKNKCPPCEPYPVGTVGYQGPKTSQRGIHGVRSGSGEMHYILFVVQQLPPEKGCTCRWQEDKRIAGHHYMNQPNPFVTVNLNGKGRLPSYP
ncbi:RHS repeat domain-containing protein, partial [Actinobacillus vicugnae]|uniref:RHS repeat domain-containing protein n=1 Tax=Actinobacillus vicugnae TaxID=2573093 RepID=UPI001241D42B